MEIGLHVANFTWPGGPGALAQDLTRVVTTAEDVGFARVSVMDHVWQIGLLGPPEHAMLEAYTTLGYLAARTVAGRAAGLGHRGRLPRARAAGEDGHDAGRAVGRAGLARHRRRLERARSQGAGAASSRRPPSGSSGWRRRCRSACRCGATTTARSRASITSSGRTLNSPQPIRRPHPPILIGGGGEKKTLRLVAQYAEACNLFAFTESSASWTCCAGTARTWAATTTRSRRP